jgi:hypothetical protein
MKPIIFLLILLVGGCVSKPVLFKDDEKKIKIHCNIYSDTLNTFENYYYGNNSLVDEHKVSFFLSSEEQQSIIDAVNNNNFFELPDSIYQFKYKPNDQGQTTVIVNFNDTFCKIELNGVKKSVFMSRSKNFDSEVSLRFESIINVITEIIERRKDLIEFHQGIWTL